jgi:hypothetical protein
VAVRSEWPIDPTEAPYPDLMAFQAGQLEALGKLDVEQQANLAAQVAADIGNRSTPVSARHSLYRRASNDFPSGTEIIAALLKEAEVAVNRFVEPGKRANTLKLLPLSRDQLELWAVRGRNLANYTARKAALGL